MYIRPTMAPVSKIGVDGIGDAIVNAAKKKIDSSRTWMDKLQDFFCRSEPEIRNLYAGRTEELLQKMVGCIAREATISCVPSSDPGSQGIYQYTIEEIDLTFEMALSPQYLTPRTLCAAMIDRYKITDPGNYPGGGNEQAIVYGFKEPRTIGMNPVELCSRSGHVVKAWTDGKILYTPPKDNHMERNIDTEAICYCLEHNLTPVRADSKINQDGILQVCVHAENIHAPDSPVIMSHFSKDRSSDRVIIDLRCHPLEGLEFARTYGGTKAEIAIDQYPNTRPPSTLSPKESAAIIQELEKQDTKLWMMQMQKTEPGEDKTLFLFLCDQSCGTPASFILLVDSSDPTKMKELTELIGKNENLSPSLLSSMLEAENVFDNDITEQIDTVMKMTQMGDFTVEIREDQSDFCQIEVSNPANQEVTTLTVSLRGREELQGGRGLLLIDALINATSGIKDGKRYIHSDQFSEELKNTLRNSPSRGLFEN